MNTIRKEVEVFAELMEQVLQKHDDDKQHWSSYSVTWLFERLKEEVSELDHALKNCDACNVKEEAIDIANFAMMISDVIQRVIKRNYEIANTEETP